MTIRKGRNTDFDMLVKIWESSVKATHSFLSKEDFEYYKSALPKEFLPQVDLYVLETTENQIKGFTGVSGHMLEMLFIDATERGKGYGRLLADFAISHLHIRKVDVNEQNEQAIRFYKKIGFTIQGKSAKDAMGKNYPILHMELKDIPR